MTHGKLNGEHLIVAPNKLKLNGRIIVSPRPSDYRAAGYLPVDTTTNIPEGYRWNDKWEIANGKIVKKYDEIPEEEQQEMDAMVILSGEEAEQYQEYQTEIEPLLEEVFG